MFSPPLSQVFGIFEGAAPNPQQPQMGALAMYPFWDEKFGKGTPTTYAVAWHNVSFENVEEISAKLTKGFTLSKDGYTATMAAALPRKLVPLLPPLAAGLLTGADFSCNILGQQKKWWLNDDLKASEIVWGWVVIYVCVWRGGGAGDAYRRLSASRVHATSISAHQRHTFVH